MPDTRRTRFNEDGQAETVGYGAEVSDSDLAGSKARARMSTTAGADLGGAAVRAKSAAPAREETDVSKMSPLQRASFEARKRRKVTASDAADALASR